MASLLRRRTEVNPPAVGRPSSLIAVVGVGLLLCGSGTIVLGKAVYTSFTATVEGGNHPVNAGAADLADIFSHNSPAVAANPRDPSNVVVVNRIDSPTFSCALHVSTDGAATWSETALPVPQPDREKCYAPDLAFSPDGTLYVSFVTLQGRGNVPHAVWTTSSDNGGRTLSDVDHQSEGIAEIGSDDSQGTGGRHGRAGGAPDRRVRRRCRHAITSSLAGCPRTMILFADGVEPPVGVLQRDPVLDDRGVEDARIP